MYFPRFFAAILLLSSCSGFDDSALVERLSKQDEKLAGMESQTAGLRSALEALQATDRVTAIEPILDQGVTVGFTVRFAKAEPMVIMLAAPSSEGLESVAVEGDKVIFTLTGNVVIALPYDAAPVITLVRDSLYVAPGGFTEVSYTIAGGDASNRIEAVAEGYWKSEIIPADAFSGKLRIRHADGCFAGKVLLLATDGSGRNNYTSAGVWPMSTDVSAKNRYSMTLYQQADGSWMLDASQTAALGGAEPEGLYEPVVNPQQVSASDIEDVPYTTVVYKTYSDRELHMNICPAVNVTEPTPVVFLTHGGGWWQGDHNTMLKVARYIAKYAGVAAVSVQYSLAGQTDVYIETSVNDLGDALIWLQTHSTEYNLNMYRVAFVGNSAGGHLSAVMAMTWPTAKVLVGWSGAYDIDKHLENWGLDVNRVQKYFHKRDAAALAPYSPVLLVPDPMYHDVRCMLIHGTADNQVLFEQAPLFAAALRAKGQIVQEEYYQYYSHGLTGNSDKNLECLAKTIDFIKDNL